MSKILVTQVIPISDPEQYKLHAARWNGSIEPLDDYVRDKKEWVDWNRYRKNRNDFNRRYIFSLINFYHETDEWLFGGIYEVLKRKKIPRSHSYEIKELKKYSKYVGRVKINFEYRGRAKALKLENFLDGMTVTEIFKLPYSGELFPGYENVNYDFSKLIPIFENEDRSWRGALSSVKGVYVIMDKSNGKKYVGSAYGDSGIWARWSCYIGTGHGWNDELTRLIKRKGYRYARENFRIALLEYRPMKADDQVIIDRETFWKEVFLSRDFGYNKN